jgi:hypothetical protein
LVIGHDEYHVCAFCGKSLKDKEREGEKGEEKFHATKRK